MKTFKEFNTPAEEVVTESKLKKESIMHNGRPSSEIIAGTGFYNDEKGEMSIWVNGGSAYEFDFDLDAAKKIRDLGYKEQQKLAADIAVKVSKLVEKEIQALEKKFK